MHQFSEILSTRYYVIPENQRGFSWGKRHVDDLIKDLQLARNQSHYMGPIIVTRTDRPSFQDAELSETSEFTLDDGQQRITTMLLFANAIRKRLEAEIDTLIDEDLERTLTSSMLQLDRLIFYEVQNGGSRFPRLQNRNSELDQYFKYLLTGSPLPPADRSPPMRALDDVQTYINGFVADLTLEELLQWKNKISNQAKFIWVDLSQESINRYLAFDAINSRGLPLSDFDKIKNFCILLENTRELNTEPETLWYQAIQSLEKFEVSSRSNEAAFISDLYAAYHDETVSRTNVHDAFVEKYRPLLTEPDPALERDLRGFIELWADYAAAFGFIASRNRDRYYGDLCSEEAGRWLTRLDNMDLPGILRPVLTAAHMRRPLEEFEQIARAAEIYTFRTHAVRRFRKDKHSKQIVTLASQILNTNKDAEFIQDQICRWLGNLAPMEKVIQRLGNGEPKYYYDPNVKGWAHCYYFLYEAEVYFSAAGTEPLSWANTQEGKRNTQEHILPQRHRDGDWWEEQWPVEAEADRYVHRLGNLALTANNNTLGRKPFPLKLNDATAPHCYTDDHATRLEQQIERFTDGDAWRTENILRREAHLLRFAAERWSLPCCADNGLIKAPEGWPEEHWNEIEVDHIECFGGPDETEEEPPADELEEDEANEEDG